MATYSSNNLRSGLRIMLDGEPYEVESREFVKPGKGQAFVRVKLRRLLTKTLIERIFKSTDFNEQADIVDIDLTYLYNDGKLWHFMNSSNFEQIAADSKSVGDNAKWLLAQSKCTVTLWNNNPIAVNPPTFVEIEVAHTTGKLATLKTGAIVKVPNFIQGGEIIKVDTRSGEYVSRVKQS